MAAVGRPAAIEPGGALLLDALAFRCGTAPGGWAFPLRLSPSSHGSHHGAVTHFLARRRTTVALGMGRARVGIAVGEPRHEAHLACCYIPLMRGDRRLRRISSVSVRLV